MDLDERATAFPSGGWLTRRGIEAEIPTYGPKALLTQQNAMAEAVRRSQESGKRREISFTSSRTHGREGRDSRDSRDSRDRERDRDHRRRREGEDRDRGGLHLHRPKSAWSGVDHRRR